MALTKIGTDGFKDDSVTTDKLANAINTERTANTAKVSLEADSVTGAKIADDAVGAEHIEQLDADLSFADNAKAKFGAGNDLEIYHDGGGSIIKDSGTGDFRIGGDGALIIMNAALDETKATFHSNGAVELYHDNSKKLETTSTGVTVTGNVSGSMASNFTMVDFDLHSSDSQTALSSNETWTTDSGLGTRTVSNYQRGQQVIVRAYVPMGIALSSSSGTNYAESRARVKITNGSANMYSPEYRIWYRADGSGTHETVTPAVITLAISASDTTFSNGDTLTVSIEGYRRDDAGNSSHFIGGWNSRKEVSIQRFAKQLA